MSFDTTLARMAALQSLIAPRVAVSAPAGPVRPLSSGGVASTDTSTFAGALATADATGDGGGNRNIVATAKAELGQVESPPGSNNSARIAEYRSAVPGGPVGPWCAYFASWVSARNGQPLGERGQGFARVDDVYAWAQRSGRAVPANASVPPKPGDLIIWDEHMGIVESVTADGRITTIEGNSSDSVARRTYGPDGGGAIGYVRMS